MPQFNFNQFPGLNPPQPLGGGRQPQQQGAGLGSQFSPQGISGGLMGVQGPSPSGNRGIPNITLRGPTQIGNLTNAGTGHRSVFGPASNIPGGTQAQPSPFGPPGGSNLGTPVGGGPGLTFPRQENTAAYPLSTVSQGNVSAFDRALQLTGGGGQQGLGAEGDPTQGLSAAMEASARAQFQQYVIPQIQERFAAVGGTDSGAYHATLARAQAEFERNLAVNSGQLALQQYQFQNPSGTSQLQGALGLANVPTFGYYVQPGQTGAEAYSQYGQGYTGGFQQAGGQFI